MIALKMMRLNLTSPLPQREMEYFVDMVLNWRCEPASDLQRHVLLERVTTGAELSWKLGREVKIEEVEGLREVLKE